MIYLLDTSIFSDLMREHPKVDARLASIAPADRVVICSVVKGEIQYGIQRLPQGARRQELASKAAKLFPVIYCEAVPEVAGDLYARIKLTRQQKGLSLDENDLWIAATAMAPGAVLITRDSDFANIDGLTVSDWSI